MKKTASIPSRPPIFDNVSFIKEQSFHSNELLFAAQDFKMAQAFLLSYQNNTATFNAYRREIERFLQWSWYIQNSSVLSLKRQNIEDYLAFCQHPPESWIGLTKVPRFIETSAQRIPNVNWRPFVVSLPKGAYRQGATCTARDYTMTNKSLREIFTVTSSFYHFLIRESHTTVNPVVHIRQKSHYFRTHQAKRKVRCLSELQWLYVIETAEQMADQSQAHERTLFIVTILYSLYLRISELSASERWTPQMKDFHRDAEGLWWFTTVGKGNKEREISVSDALLQALKRYRYALNLTPLPSRYESTPLILKNKGKGPICSTSQIRVIVQRCFDAACARLKKDGFLEDADHLSQATVHWLRHTGISEDVKYRPLIHVRDDAGHSSSTTTDLYIDVARQARHHSAKKKSIRPDH